MGGAQLRRVPAASWTNSFQRWEKKATPCSLIAATIDVARPLDDPNVRIVISNTNVKHELGSGEYAVRRQQCEAAVAALQKNQPTLKLLRDATVAMLQESRSAWTISSTGARHVITEIARTTEFAASLEKTPLRPLRRIDVRLPRLPA